MISSASKQFQVERGPLVITQKSRLWGNLGYEYISEIAN